MELTERCTGVPNRNDGDHDISTLSEELERWG